MSVSVLSKAFNGCIENIHINELLFPVISIQVCPIGILPECPLNRVGGLFVYRTYPDIIALKLSSNKAIIECFSRIDHRPHSVFRLNRIQPIPYFRNHRGDVLYRFILSIRFYVDNWRKHIIDIRNCIDEVLCLFLTGRFKTKEMIGSGPKSCLCYVFPVCLKHAVRVRRTFCRFDKSEHYALCLQFVPIDISLIMRNIYSSYWIDFPGGPV